MKIFNDKKGIVTHPVTLFIVAVIVGLVVAYLWVKYTTVPNPFC